MNTLHFQPFSQMPCGGIERRIAISAQFHQNSMKNSSSSHKTTLYNMNPISLNASSVLEVSVAIATNFEAYPLVNSFVANFIGTSPSCVSSSEAAMKKFFESYPCVVITMSVLTISFLSYKIITGLKSSREFQDTIQIEALSEDTQLANATNHTYESFFDAQEEVTDQNEYECFFDAQEEVKEQNEHNMIFFDAQEYSDENDYEHDHCAECFFDAQEHEENADNDANDYIHSQDALYFFDAQEYSDAHDYEHDHCTECFFDAQENDNDANDYVHSQDAMYFFDAQEYSNESDYEQDLGTEYFLDAEEGFDKSDVHQFTGDVVDTQEGRREIACTDADLSSDTSDDLEERLCLADEFSDCCPQLIDEGNELEQLHQIFQCSSMRNQRRETKVSFALTDESASIDTTSTVRDQGLNLIIKEANEGLRPSKKTSRHTIQIKYAELGLHRYQDERGRQRIRSRRARTTSPR